MSFFKDHGVGMIGEGGTSTWGVEDKEMTEELQKEAKVTQPDQKDTAHATGTIPCICIMRFQCPTYKIWCTYMYLTISSERTVQLYSFNQAMPVGEAA